jgi:NAD-dependent SIR2 family protein deacetylase
VMPSPHAPCCPKCGVGKLRPHVFLFGDGARFANVQSVTNAVAYKEWTDAVVVGG